MDKGIEVVARSVTETIMLRIQRDNEISLRTIVRDEITAMLERIATAQGWPTWPAHQ